MARKRQKNSDYGAGPLKYSGALPTREPVTVLNADAPRPVLSLVRAHAPKAHNKAVPSDIAALFYRAVPPKADPAMLAYWGSDTFISSLFARKGKTGANDVRHLGRNARINLDRARLPKNKTVHLHPQQRYVSAHKRPATPHDHVPDARTRLTSLVSGLILVAIIGFTASLF
jgi:hypothetical protein